MAKEKQNSDFINFFKQDKEALENLKKMKSAQIPGAPPEIAEGDYVARMVAGTLTIREFKVGNAKKKAPMIKLRMVVDRGAYEGTSLTKDYILDRLSDKMQMTKEQIYERCAQDLIAIGCDKNCFSSPEALSEEIETLASEKPLLRIRVKTNAKGYVNIYINGLAEDARAAAEEDEVDDAEESDEEELDEEELEEEGDDSDDEEVELSIGDRVRYAPKGGRKSTWSIHGVDETARTVSLRDVAGKVVKSVPWDELEVVG